MSTEIEIARIGGEVPPIIQQLTAANAEIRELTDRALSLAVSEETRQEAKKTRAELNKIFAGFEERRKAIKKAFLAPYEEFEKHYKELVTEPMKEADAELAGKIKAVEGALIAEKAERAERYFSELWEVYQLDGTGLTRPPVVVSLSESDKKTRERLEEECKKYRADIDAILNMDDAAGILAEYVRGGGNLADAITKRKAARELERLAEVAKARREEAERETAKAEEVAGLHAPTVDAPEVYEVIFTVTGTLAEIKAIKSYMEERGIKYHD